jgi:hypothetical protein
MWPPSAPLALRPPPHRDKRSTQPPLPPFTLAHFPTPSLAQIIAPPAPLTPLSTIGDQRTAIRARVGIAAATTSPLCELPPWSPPFFNSKVPYPLLHAPVLQDLPEPTTSHRKLPPPLKHLHRPRFSAPIMSRCLGEPPLPSACLTPSSCHRHARGEDGMKIRPPPCHRLARHNDVVRVTTTR